MHGKTTICMEKEFILTLMAVYMKVTFRMVSNVAMEYKIDYLERATMVSGRMAKSMEDS